MMPTVVRSASAPIENSTAQPCLLTELNASASGASIFIWLYFTMPVTTRATATYSAVSKPINAKNSRAAAGFTNR